MSSVHGPATQLLSLVMAVLGVAILVRTLAGGGGVLSVGVVFGLLFLLAGAGRFHVSRRGAST